MELFKDKQYEITKKDKDWRMAVVQVTEPVKTEVTIFDIEEHQKNLSVKKREADGNVDMQRVRAENIETNHPFISKMSEEKLYTCWLYYETKKKQTEFEAQRDLLVEALDLYQKEKEHIIKVLGPIESDVWLEK